MKTLEKYYEKLCDWKPIQVAEAIDISGAAKWYWESAGFHGNYWSEFPSPIPPYECTWLEYEGPTYGTDGDGNKFVLSRTSWRGWALIGATRVRDKRGDVVSWNDFSSSPAMALLPRGVGLSFASQLYDQFINGTKPEDTSATWFFVMQTGLADYESSLGIKKGPSWIASLDSMGNLVPYSLRMRAPDGTKAATDGMTDRMIEEADYHGRVFFLALSLMNAKNVSLVDAPPLPPKVLKRREREGKSALKFKVLQIDPMRARVKREAKPGENEVKVALHLCRGHFKDYRESGGLFGKYKGLYWWDSQVRGTDESGRIIKDYALNAPPEA